MSQQDIQDTDPSSDSDGHASHARPWAARLLAFIAPGLGHWYAGRPLAAVLTNLGAIFVLLLFVIGASLWQFFLLGPAAVLILSWAFLCWARGSDARRIIIDDPPSPGLLRHPLILALIALITFIIPLTLTLHVSARHLHTVVAIDDTAMSPHLEAGDRVTVDRTGFGDAPPERGDLVVLRNPSSGELTVRRIIGLPNEHIQLFGHTVAINDQQAHYERYDIKDDTTTLWREQIDHHHHLIRLDHGPRADHPIDRFELEDDQFFLLADQRTLPASDNSRPQDSRDFGPVTADALEGRPAHIAWSTDNGYVPRLARLGLRPH